MAIPMQRLLVNTSEGTEDFLVRDGLYSNRQIYPGMPDYIVNYSNHFLLLRFFTRMTDFSLKKTDFGNIFRLAHTKML